MVTGIGNVEVARAVHGHAIGVAELRLDRRTPVPAEAEPSGPRDRGDDPCGVHLADALVAGFGNVEVARPVHRHATGVVELRLDRRTPVPTEAELPGPRDRGDRPRRIHLADAVVTGIGDVEVARPVHRHATGVVELRLDRRTPVYKRWPSGEGGDCPVGISWNIYQLPTGRLKMIVTIEGPSRGAGIKYKADWIGIVGEVVVR